MHFFPPHWPVSRGLDVYFAENGFSAAAYDAPRATASLFGVDVSYPNTPAHRWALRRHDLHHVATGYGSDHLGEGELSAWEAASGLGAMSWWVRAIVLLGIAVGLLLSRRRVVAAWRAGRQARSLFIDDAAPEVLERLTIGELRERLGIPRDGLCFERGLHARAPEHQKSVRC